MATGPIAEDEIPRISRSPWADNFFRPVLITVMITCISISVVNLVQLLNPAWRGTYFLIGMVLVTVEAIYSYRLLRIRQVRGGTILRYRLAEMVVLLLVLKALSFANKSLPAIWAELQLIWQDPFNFINLEYYLLLVLSMFVWLAATNTVEDFEALHDPYTFYSDHITPLESLASRFFWGGGILVLISGVSQWLARAGLASLLDLRRPSLGGIIFNVLVYFALGLVMLSQAHLTRLLVRWRIQKISVAPDLVKRWARYGLIFLGLVTLVVFLLPTGYTLGFLTSAGLVIGLVLDIIMLILQLLFLLLSLPLVWLLSLMGQELQTLPRQPLVPPQVPYYPPGVAGPSWLEVLRSLLFWLVLGAIMWYLLKVYFSDQPGLIGELKRIKVVGFFIELLAAFWRWLAGWTQAGWDLIPKKVDLTGRAGGLRSRLYRRWAGLGSLSPREQILYYYLNIVERTKERGPRRAPYQTPYEYQPRLTEAIPDTEQEVTILTRAFVQARYSLEAFDETQAQLARALWQRIRRALTEREQQKPRDEG